MIGEIISLGASFGNLVYSAARNDFKMQYEISPIMLKGGIAGESGNMPIVELTQLGSYPIALDNYFAHWKPMSGSTLAQNTIGQYPFANQSVAANAVISQPLNVSMLMICPANSETNFSSKANTFNALKQSIDKHISLGGLFVIMTPSYVYDNCILTGIRDISGGETSQPQYMWAWDFIRPQVVTMEEAQGAQNGLMSKISSGSKVTNTNWSGSH